MLIGYRRSGTRAVCHALQALGVFMGTRLDGAGDAMDFEPILDDGINAVLRTTEAWTMTRTPSTSIFGSRLSSDTTTPQNVPW